MRASSAAPPTLRTVGRVAVAPRQAVGDAENLALTTGPRWRRHRSCGGVDRHRPSRVMTSPGMGQRSRGRAGRPGGQRQAGAHLDHRPPGQQLRPAAMIAAFSLPDRRLEAARFSSLRTPDSKAAAVLAPTPRTPGPSSVRLRAGSRSRDLGVAQMWSHSQRPGWRCAAACYGIW